MLSNAYFLAKFRFDTAENEPAKNLTKFSKNVFSKNVFSKNAEEEAPSQVCCAPRFPRLRGVAAHRRRRRRGGDGPGRHGGAPPGQIREPRGRRGALRGGVGRRLSWI